MAPCGIKGFGVDHRAIPNLLCAFDDDFFSGFEAFTDNPVRSDALAGLHQSQFNLVVGADHRNEVLALNFRNCPLGHQQRPLLHIGRGPYLGELSRAQARLRVGEQASDLERARRRIDLPVEQGEPAGPGVDAPIDQDHLQGHLFGFPRYVPGTELEVFAFADIDIHLDRIDRGNGRQLGCRAGAEQVADLRFGNTGDAIDR